MGGVHEFADSQISRPFGSDHGVPLKELKVRGEIRRPVERLVQLLETDDFKSQRHRHLGARRHLRRQVHQHARRRQPSSSASAALFRAHEACKAARVGFEAALERGQFSTAALDAFDTFDLDIVVSDVKYTVTVKRTGDASFDLVTNGGPALAAKVREQPTALYSLLMGASPTS